MKAANLRRTCGFLHLTGTPWALRTRPPEHFGLESLCTEVAITSAGWPDRGCRESSGPVREPRFHRSAVTIRYVNSEARIPHGGSRTGRFGELSSPMPLGRRPAQFAAVHGRSRLAAGVPAFHLNLRRSTFIRRPGLNGPADPSSAERRCHQKFPTFRRYQTRFTSPSISFSCGSTSLAL